ncbi:hypothetical protein Acsp01_88360 [Actinoplanes sp. NBRC 101535]|nr:hypothetical protein Acsp01_88360 [Actinoplanes sp. NBRC 101535]
MGSESGAGRGEGSTTVGSGTSSSEGAAGGSGTFSAEGAAGGSGSADAVRLTVGSDSPASEPASDEDAADRSTVGSEPAVGAAGNRTVGSAGSSVPDVPLSAAGVGLSVFIGRILSPAVKSVVITVSPTNRPAPAAPDDLTWGGNSK